MPPTLRAKERSSSLTKAMTPIKSPSAGTVGIDPESAWAWGRANGVDVTNAKDALKSINVYRVKLGLPRFALTHSNLTVAPQGPEAATVTPAIEPIAETEAKLLTLVTSHIGTITGLMTPAAARWLLELNTGNRPIQKVNAERFRSILRDGEWQNTGEPIIVSREGILNDGQHRLTAICETGVAAEMDVRFGIARAAFAATGTGKRRTASNVLSIENYGFASCQAAIARLLHFYDAGEMGQWRGQVEISKILSIVEKQEIIGAVAAKIQKLKFKPVRTGPFGFVLVVGARSTLIERVFEFADAVASGLAAEDNEPSRRLHIKLRDIAMSKQRLQQIDLAAMSTLAWNAWLEGRRLPILKVTDADRSSVGFPKIKGSS